MGHHHDRMIYKKNTNLVKNKKKTILNQYDKSILETESYKSNKNSDLANGSQWCNSPKVPLFFKLCFSLSGFCSLPLFGICSQHSNYSTNCQFWKVLRKLKCLNKITLILIIFKYFGSIHQISFIIENFNYASNWKFDYLLKHNHSPRKFTGYSAEDGKFSIILHFIMIFRPPILTTSPWLSYAKSTLKNILFDVLIGIPIRILLLILLQFCMKQRKRKGWKYESFPSYFLLHAPDSFFFSNRFRRVRIYRK